MVFEMSSVTEAVCQTTIVMLDLQDAGKEAELQAEIARLKASLQEKDSEIEQLRTRLAKYEN